MAAMATVPSYTPSLWVRLCHALPRLDLSMQMKDNVFVPDSWEYQQVTDTCCCRIKHDHVTTHWPIKEPMLLSQWCVLSCNESTGGLIKNSFMQIFILRFSV